MTIIMTNMSRRLQYEPLFLSTNEAERKNVGDGKKEKENSFLAVLKYGIRILARIDR
jgi:hypothetical protein